MMTFTNDRTFQVWAYSVSHAQLLLRSPSDAAHSKNIDIAFVGVDRMDLVTGCTGIEVEEVAATGARHRLRRFKLSSNGTHVGTIDAVDVRVSENTLDHSETDLPYFTVRSVMSTDA